MERQDHLPKGSLFRVRRAKVRSGQNQGPWTLFLSPVWVQGPKLLHHVPQLSQVQYERGGQDEQEELQLTFWKWDAEVSQGGLLNCATLPAHNLYV